MTFSHVQQRDATAAEAVRRTEELVRRVAAGGVAAPMPTTLAITTNATARILLSKCRCRSLSEWA
jgi:hypothetical protein